MELCPRCVLVEGMIMIRYHNKHQQQFPIRGEKATECISINLTPFEAESGMNDECSGSGTAVSKFNTDSIHVWMYSRDIPSTLVVRSGAMGGRRGARVRARVRIMIFRKCRRIEDPDGCPFFLRSYRGITPGLP